jgi:hypothetical protein
MALPRRTLLLAESSISARKTPDRWKWGSIQGVSETKEHFLGRHRFN